ncbi:MAG: hypothetical protein RLP14_07930 [Owenweeksia sp.]
MKIIYRLLCVFLFTGSWAQAQENPGFKNSYSAGSFINTRGVAALEFAYGIHPNLELTFQAGYMDRAKRLESGTYGTPASSFVLYGSRDYRWYRGPRAGLGFRFNTNRKRLLSFSLGSSVHQARLRHYAFHESTQEEIDPFTFETERTQTYATGAKEATHWFLNVDLRTRFQVKFVYLEVSWLAEVTLNEDEDLQMEGSSSRKSQKPLTSDMTLPLGLGLGVHFDL